MQGWLEKSTVVQNGWLEKSKVVKPESSIVSIDAGPIPFEPRKSVDKMPEFGRGMPITSPGESRTAYLRRLGQHFNFSKVPEKHAEKYDILQEAAAFTPGRQKDLARVVKRIYGDQATLAKHSGYPEPVILFDSGEVVPFNQPGLTMQDVRGLKAPTAVLGMEVGGGVLGALVGNVPGSIAGVGAGSFAGEFLRLKRGKEVGLHDLSNAEIAGRAAIDAAIASGLEIGTLGLGAIVRRMVQNPVSKRALGDLKEEEIEAAIDAAEKYYEETGERLTAGQAVQEAQRAGNVEGLERTAAEMRTNEQALIESGDAPGLRQQLRSQTEKIGQETEKAIGDAAEDLLESPEVGRTIQEAGQRELEDAVRKQDILADVQRGQQEDIINAKLVVPSEAETADALRGYIQSSKDDTFKQLSKRYEDFKALAPDDTEVSLKLLKGCQKNGKASLKETFFQPLQKRIAFWWAKRWRWKI